MNKRDLYKFLALEIFAVFWAGLVFYVIHDRLIAGGLAGAYFVLSAAYMLNRIRRWPARVRALTLYPLLVHLFGVAIPMLVVRFTHLDEPFENISIWGLEGPQFHRLSTNVFTILIFATLIDLWRARRAESLKTLK